MPNAACPNCGSPLGVGGCTYAFCQNHNGPTKSAASSFGKGNSSHTSLLEAKVPLCPKCGRRHA